MLPVKYPEQRSNNMVRKLVILEGNVQGVGLRVRLRDLARELDIGGRCRNLPDRTVEVHLGGEAESLRRFLDKIKGWKSKEPLILEAHLLLVIIPGGC